MAKPRNDERAGTTCSPRLSRRRFLRDSFAVAGAAALGGVAEGARPPSAPARRIIDVHVHAAFDDEVLQRQAKTLSRVDFSPAGLAAEMAANGVERALSIGFATAEGELSHGAENPIGLDGDGASGMERVGLVGGVNPYDLDREGLARVERALAAGRLAGLKIYLGYYHFGPGHEPYKRIYELAARHRVPVVFHTGDTYAPNAKVRFAEPLPIDDVAVDFRDTTFVLAHLGNPWTLDAAELLYKNPNVYADLSGFLVGDGAYFTDSANAEGIGHAVARIREAFAWAENAEKFLYGSDWPLVPMRAYFEFVERAIDPPFRDRVFYLNAKKVFRL